RSKRCIKSESRIAGSSHAHAGRRTGVGHSAGKQMSRTENVASKTEQILEQFADLETFHSQDAEPYALLSVNGKRNVIPIRGSEFAEALTYLYFQKTGKSPGTTAITDAVGVLSAR